MLFDYNECRKRFSSPYQIEKAVEDCRIYKMMPGVYSDTGAESELEVLQARYPKSVLTLETAYQYYNLTDVISDVYTFATPRNAPRIKDERIKQYYVPGEVFGVGMTTAEFEGEKLRIYDRERLLIETVRMKERLPLDLYREVINSFRKVREDLYAAKIGDYLEGFGRKEGFMKIIEAEVF